ncbi:hypothetical protein [Burkholderia vietnamiensis]|uniref:hypothetical protein n=1 Tax=Burkholderia vietnamiensis TaxID=60552 RepID=UPI000A41C0F2|nr:hypothetical protein [Burkholderia vietnamiensis]
MSARDSRARGNIHHIARAWCDRMVRAARRLSTSRQLGLGVLLGFALGLIAMLVIVLQSAEPPVPRVVASPRGAAVRWR